MCSHSQAPETSQRLCDALVAHLDSTLRGTGGADRKESSNWCSIGYTSGRRVAFIRHRKVKTSLRVYLPAGLAPTMLPSGLSLTRRRTAAKGWEKEFPHSIEITEESVLPEVAAALVAALVNISTSIDDPGVRLPDELPDGRVYREGTFRQITVNAHERSPDARRRCIAHHGSACVVCQFDFGNAYGTLGRGLIHVHHLNPMSEAEGQREVDPVLDLRPVCPNCHAMIHTKEPPFSIDEIQTMLLQRRAPARAPSLCP